MKAFEPGSGNTYTYHTDPEPIDNQAEVKVYRLNPDGSKGEFLRTMPAYPEGWDERRFVPGAGGKKKEKEEDDSKMARVRKDKEEIMAKARPMLAEGLSIKKTAKELDVPTTTLFQWIKKEEEKQTQPPEPDQAANQEPEREEMESAEDIIPKTEMGCPFDEEAFNPDIPEVVEDAFPASAFTIVDEEEPFPYTVTEEKAFNLDTFKMRVLEIFQEVARANQAPAYVNLAFMNAIIDTYPEKGE